MMKKSYSFHGTGLFNKYYCLSAGIYALCSLMLISCSNDPGDWTAVQQEGRYIYGVWHSPTEKQAEYMMLKVTENVKNSTEPEDESPVTTEVLRTTVAPEQLLPNNGEELSGWIQSNAPAAHRGKELYQYRFASPDLYHAYGFQQQAEVEYQTPRFGSKPLILLEIFDMGTPENAFGIYNIYTYPQMTSEWIGSIRAMILGDYLRFAKGKYFVQLESYELATGIREGMIHIAKAIATQIKDPVPEPRILELLPHDEKVRETTKLFRSNWTLSKIYSTLPDKVPQLTAAAIGVSARYGKNIDAMNWKQAPIVFIIRFPNIDTAATAYTHYRDTLPLLTEGAVDAEKSTDSRILINEPPDASIERKGISTK